MTSSAKIADVDRGWSKIAGRLAAKDRVRVGILTDEPKREHDGEDGPMDLLEVAAIHEFGAPAANIPQRSFIRATVDEHADEIRELQIKLAEQIALGKIDGPTAMQRLGAKVAGWMKLAIARGIEPPLSPATVERKGSSKPLIDTGQLRSSISFVVEKEGR